MEIKRKVGKTVDALTESIIKNLSMDFEDSLGVRAKEIILEDYNLKLNGVANPRSKIAPENLMGEFTDRLNDFKYIKKYPDGIKIIIPDMTNIPFYGKLRPLENLLNGLIGRYLEVEGIDYRRATGKLTYRGQHIRADVVYLFKDRKEVREWSAVLGKKFELHPFSNHPPIDIFTRSEEFIDNNLDKFTDEVAEKSTEKLPRRLWGWIKNVEPGSWRNP
jgi:hypothetical protein